MVGYVERCEVPEGGDDEQTFWREYLLYHRSEGFAFLVDAEDGWSWVDADHRRAAGRAATASSTTACSTGKLYDYAGKVTYVLGEFYWRVATRRSAPPTPTTWAPARRRSERLNRERDRRRAAPGRRRLVGGRDARRAAFKPRAGRRHGAAALQRDALPTPFNGGAAGKIFFWIFIVIVWCC